MNYDSKTEKDRLKTEQAISTTGKPILPSQIWLFEKLIPDVAPQLELLYDYKNTHYGELFLEVNKKNESIIQRYNKLTLTRVEGTKDTYFDPMLKDIIPYNYDIEGSYVPKIFIDGSLTAFGQGNPVFDPSAGTVRFQELAFAEYIYKCELPVSISFYRYSGKKGLMGEHDGYFGADLPFYDDLTLLKSAQFADVYALFELHGEKGTTKYILPKIATHPYTIFEGYYDGENNAAAIVTQGNLNSVLYEKGIVDGGVYTSN